MVTPTRRRLLGGLVVAALVAVMLNTAATAHYEAVHVEITKAAVKYLVQLEPSMAACENTQLVNALTFGVEQEDREAPGKQYVGRYFGHFWPALNDEVDSPLGRLVRARGDCNSISWANGFANCGAAIELGDAFQGLPAPIKGILGNLLATYLESTTLRNEYGYPLVIADLINEPGPLKARGWRGLGHFLHLVQDLTSPPHTQNDAHPHDVFAAPAQSIKDVIGPLLIDPSAFEVANNGTPPMVPPATGGLIPIGTPPWDTPFAAMRELQRIVSTRFPSEKTAATHPAVVGQRPTQINPYVGDPAGSGARVAHWEWGTRQWTVDALVAKETFQVLAALAIQYTASIIKYVHDTQAPVCEQEVQVEVRGLGLVTSNQVRWPGQTDQISCGSDAPGAQVCERAFPSGATVTLTAEGDNFEGWDTPSAPGSCPGTDPCVVPINGKDPIRVEAKFGGDPVAGVYELIAVNGGPLPSALIDRAYSVTSASIRLDEPTLPNQDTRSGQGTIQYVFFPDNGAPFPGTFGLGIGSYRVRDISDVPVLSGLFNPIPGAAPLLLPPGLVVEGVFGGFGGSFFAPQMTLAADGRTLTMFYRFSNTPVRLTFLRRDPTRTASFDPSPRELRFPATKQGDTSDPQTITITNTGTDTLSVSGLTSSSTQFALAGGTCGSFSFLGTGMTCTYQVVYKPSVTYVTGVRSGTLSVLTNAGSVSGSTFRQTPFEVSGEATGSPVAAFAPTDVQFPGTMTGTTSPPEFITITNTGTLPLVVSAISLSTFEFALDDQGCRFTTLPANGNCVMTATFSPSPSGNTTERLGEISITTNTGSTQGSRPTVSSVRLRGNAVYAAPTANAGPDLPLAIAGSAVALNGSASDPLGRPLIYQWSLVSVPSGSSAALLSSADSPNAFLTPDVPGVYTLEFVVNNGFVSSAPDAVVVTARAIAPPPPPGTGAPEVTGVGFVTLRGRWRIAFYGGDDDEAFWIKVGNDPEFEWEADEMPGKIVDVDFGAGGGTIRFAEDDSGEDLRPMTVEPLADGRYLLHLRDDDPPNEIEVTLVFERVP